MLVRSFQAFYLAAPFYIGLFRHIINSNRLVYLSRLLYGDDMHNNLPIDIHAFSEELGKSGLKISFILHWTM